MPPRRILSAAINGGSFLATHSTTIVPFQAGRTAPRSPQRILCRLSCTEPQSVETLMIGAFMPVPHGTFRRIAKQQLRLTRADITQQALSVFLQVLRSEQVEKRQSHFAFAISRAVKRQLFEWAGREGAVHEPRREEQQGLLPLVDDELMERHATLRHFLPPCVSKG